MKYQFDSSRQSGVAGSVPGTPSKVLSVAVCLICLGGCQEEKIHTYTATKVKPMPLPEMQEPPGMGHTGIPEPTRMLGAILRRADETWYFKLTAPPDEAAALREQFGKFVASTRFENGQPAWEIPTGWIERTSPPGSMRFTTFEVAPGGPEISIIPLPNNGEETEAAVENVNRWRGQLGLAQLSPEEYQRALDSDNDAQDVLPEDEGEIVTITTAAGKVVLVDFVGEMATGGGPPFANMGGRPMGPAPSQFGPAGPPPGPVGPPPTARNPKLHPPESWTEAERDVVSVEAFQAGAGDDACRITLSLVGGDLLSNVNRWRDQVGLPPWSADELAKAQQTLAGDGFSADYFELTGPVETILGAVVIHNGSPLIVKLRGPNKPAAAEIGNFKKFVQSIEF